MATPPLAQGHRGNLGLSNNNSGGGGSVVGYPQSQIRRPTRYDNQVAASVVSGTLAGSDIGAGSTLIGGMAGNAHNATATSPHNLSSSVPTIGSPVVTTTTTATAANAAANLPAYNSAPGSGAATSASSNIGSGNINNNNGNSNNDARQRQMRRDEIIRRNAERELSRRATRRGGTVGGGGGSGGGGQSGSRGRIKPGTVAALRPGVALTVEPNQSIIEVAHLMAAKRADSVLVVDGEQRLVGIFTAKDIAFRVVAESLDPRNTLVSHIMTSNPVCVTSDTGINDALDLMVSRGFRHLPVTSEDGGDVVGLLDIIKCLIDALDQMERRYDSTKKLYDALENVEREWNNSNVNDPHINHFVELMRNRMICPDLTSILNENQSTAVQVNPRTSVREIAKLMKINKTTAVLVVDENNGQIVGIFTSKDIVLRVLTAGYDPSNCSVVRVMTPKPDTALPNTSIIDALRKMHDNHFLNLPIVDQFGAILGLVDVLKLCYAVLKQMNSINANNDNNINDSNNNNAHSLMEAASSGPVWSRFFSGINSHHDTDTDSQYMSGSQVGSQTHSYHHYNTHSHSHSHTNINTNTNASGSVIAHSHSMATAAISPLAGRAASRMSGPVPDIYPNDSASVADEIASAISSHVRETAVTNNAISASSVYQTALSPIPLSSSPSNNQITTSQDGNDVDNGSSKFLYKFRSIVNPANVHRFTTSTISLSALKAAVATKMRLDDPNNASIESIIEVAGLSYLDDEQDRVLLSSDGDLHDAVRLAKANGWSRLVLVLNNNESLGVSSLEAQGNITSASQPDESLVIVERPASVIPITRVNSDVGTDGGAAPAAAVTIAKSISIKSHESVENSGQEEEEEEEEEEDIEDSEDADDNVPIVPEPVVSPIMAFGGAMAVAVIAIIIIMRFSK
ncbi:CBS-domain-containing protein [Ramicandelaber brevisporus]|nr:CBS-domain-containing protein [Ramicandelaber brevisporus]